MASHSFRNGWLLSHAEDFHGSRLEGGQAPTGEVHGALQSRFTSLFSYIDLHQAFLGHQSAGIPSTAILRSFTLCLSCQRRRGCSLTAARVEQCARNSIRSDGTREVELEPKFYWSMDGKAAPNRPTRAPAPVHWMVPDRGQAAHRQSTETPG